MILLAAFILAVIYEAYYEDNAYKPHYGTNLFYISREDLHETVAGETHSKADCN